MNILMVTERYLPIWGGAENQLKQLIPHLSVLGCTIKIVTRRWHQKMPSVERIEDTEVFRLGIPGVGIVATIIFIFALTWFIIRHRAWIDILHSHGAVNMGALCKVFACLLGKKNVAKIASAGRILPLYATWRGRIILRFFKQSDAIISMTEEIDRELAVIGAEHRKVKRIVNGVDSQRFYPLDPTIRTRIRDGLGLAESDSIVLFSSRLVVAKGLRVLLDAWPAIFEKHCKAWLIIVGSGENQKNSVEEEVKKRVVEELALVNVKFMGETNQPERFLGAADVFVFPSRREGFPNALMEALVAGVPVVASDIGGVTGIIVNNQIGTLFEAGNAEALAEKVNELLDDLVSAKERALLSRRYMMENFSFPSIALRYFSLYKELLFDSSNIIN